MEAVEEELLEVLDELEEELDELWLELLLELPNPVNFTLQPMMKVGFTEGLPDRASVKLVLRTEVPVESKTSPKPKVRAPVSM